MRKKGEKKKLKEGREAETGRIRPGRSPKPAPKLKKSG